MGKICKKYDTEFHHFFTNMYNIPNFFIDIVIIRFGNLNIYSLSKSELKGQYLIEKISQDCFSVSSWKREKNTGERHFLVVCYSMIGFKEVSWNFKVSAGVTVPLKHLGAIALIVTFANRKCWGYW